MAKKTAKANATTNPNPEVSVQSPANAAIRPSAGVVEDHKRGFGGGGSSTSPNQQQRRKQRPCPFTLAERDDVLLLQHRVTNKPRATYTGGELAKHARETRTAGYNQAANWWREVESKRRSGVSKKLAHRRRDLQKSPLL